MNANSISTSRMVRTWAALAGATLGAPPALAGAWTLPAGEGQAIVSVLGDSATANFDDGGQRVGGVDFRKFEASAYMEYGVTDRVTVLMRPAYQQVELRGALGDVQEAQGAAATEIGARVATLRSDRGAVSIQLGGFVPGAGENLIDARFGEGGLAGEARALAAFGWSGPAPGFVEGQVAARVFEGQDEVEGRVDLSAGVDVTPSAQVIAQSFLAWSDGEGAIDRRAYRSHKVQLSLVQDVSRNFALQAGAFQTVAGRNVVEERAGFFAVWLSY